MQAMGREASTEGSTRIVLADHVDPELEGPLRLALHAACLPLGHACDAAALVDCQCAAGIAAYGALDMDVLERFIAYRVCSVITASVLSIDRLRLRTPLLPSIASIRLYESKACAK